MRVAVLGGGVIGVTTAHYLARDGHDVTVFDRQPGPAMETSFANAGQVSPGYAAPWAGPGIPVKAIRWLLMRHGPLLVRPTIDLHQWVWMLEAMRNCTARRYAVNKGRMLRLANYSRDLLKQLRAEFSLAYDEGQGGTLQLFRTRKQLDGIGSDSRVLDQFDQHYEILDQDGCIRLEPALERVRHKFVGGLRLPGDETGDCRLFTERLADIATANGVTFHFSSTIEDLLVAGNRVTTVATSTCHWNGDAIVVALGSFSCRLMSRLGIRLPVYPVKGYSITLPVIDSASAPISTVMDETYKTAITRLGSRIRVGGTAEISGYNLVLREDRRRALDFCVHDLFPAAGTSPNVDFWSGLRPMTPDGTPILGRTRIANLFLNTGHGTLGWTMACGSAKLLADLVAGRATEIESGDLSIARYGQ